MTKRSTIGRILALLLVGLVSAPRALAQGEVTVSATLSADSVPAGSNAVIAVVLDHLPGWHSWPSEDQDVLPKDIADFAIRTKVSITQTPAQIAAVFPTQWPEPHDSPVANPLGDPLTIEVPTYSGRAVVYLPIKIADDATGTFTIPVMVSYQACDEAVCKFPENVELEVSVTVGDLTNDQLASGAGDFQGFDAAIFDLDPANLPDRTSGAQSPDGKGPMGIILLILASALGGLVLNLTPCVLPVIPLKVMTLVKHGGDRRERTLMLGGWMALGVVAFWVAMGLPMAFLNSALDPSRLLFGNWWVTLGLGLIIALLSVGIMGLFTISLPQSVYAINPKADTPHGSFLFGVMTAVLGLPCFGFVAGGLLVGAATMPPIQIMAVFGGLGVGMAFPYLVLAAFPKLIERIPRTGPASDLVKQVMGLLMFAAAAFFIAVGIYMLILKKPWMATNMKWWLVVLFVGMAGGWLILRTFQITRRAGPRMVFSLAALAGVLGMGWFAADSTAHSKVEHLARASVAGSDDYVLGAWNHYTPARFEKALADGKAVVIDFTAEWCLNCKAYKRAVLDREPVKSRLRAGDVVAFEGDVTVDTDPANDLMEELGVTGIPLLAIWGPEIENALLSNQATGTEVVRRIDQAVGNRDSAPQ